MTKFPKRPTGVEHARRTLAEIQNILKKPRLSPEMRSGLEQRVAALKEEIRGTSEAPPARPRTDPSAK